MSQGSQVNKGQIQPRTCLYTDGIPKGFLHTHSVHVYTHVFKETKPNVRVPEASMLLVCSGPHGLQSGTHCCPQGQGRALAAGDGTGHLAGLRGRSRAFETGRVSEKQGEEWDS